MTSETTPTTPVPVPFASRRRLLTGSFVAAAALSSVLLFTVQPIVARVLLPPLGGSPAVWNTSMVFFQGVLLIGYLGAHVVRRRVGWSVRPWLQIAVVAVGLVALPVAYPEGWLPPTANQPAWVLVALAVIVGLPFLGLSMLSPTLQGWFAETDHPNRENPYFLYAAGNAGSIVGLLAYPLVLEPAIGLTSQARWWAVGYGVLCVLLVVCAGQRRRHEVAPGDRVADRDPGVGSVPWRRRLAWAGLAAVPSGLLLAVTLTISTDIAAIPLLWVLPLVIYLGTFVAAFSGRFDERTVRIARWAIWAALPLGAVMVASEWLVGGGWLLPLVVVHLGAFGAMALAIHVRLAVERPPPDHLTDYYVWVSAGGFVGGAFAALVAPTVFDDVTEYGLLVAVALLILWRTSDPTGRGAASLAVGSLLWAMGAVLVGSAADPFTVVSGAAVVVTALGVLSRAGFARVTIGVLAVAAVVLGFVSFEPVLHQERSFFGVVSVLEVGDEHVLVHGTTVHGRQVFDPSPDPEPLAYYRRGSGIERLMSALPGPERRFGMVGLGAGSLAGWGRVGDSIVFYEIDRHVVDIASDPSLFTHLSDSEATIDVEVVDGRIGLERSAGGFDLIVLDAFSSDSVPTHLLTLEAMQVYADRLAPAGTLAVHVSNRYFDLAPVVARLAAELGFRAHAYADGSSLWVAVVDPADTHAAIGAELDGWSHIGGAGAPLWTDDYVNVIGTMRRG